MTMALGLFQNSVKGRKTGLPIDNDPLWHEILNSGLNKLRVRIAEIERSGETPQ
jgi:hypothetical protein